MKFQDLKVGIEYKEKGGNTLYRILEDGCLEFKNNHVKSWVESSSTYNRLILLDFEEAEFNPILYEQYFYPSFPSLEGFGSNHFDNDFIDNKIKRIAGIFRTKEEAIKKAKELGWL